MVNDILYHLILYFMIYSLIREFLKMLKKKLKIGRVVFPAVLIPVLALILTLGVVGAILFRSFVTGKGSIAVGEVVDSTITLTVTGTAGGSATTSGSDAFSLTKAGDSISFALTMNNTSGADLLHSAVLTVKSLTQNGSAVTADSDLDKALRSCILVYLDGEFVDSLAHLTQEGSYEFVTDAPLPNTVSDTHTVKLELHEEATQYANVSFTVTVTDTAENADARNYIFVENESEFAHAINDINSGLLRDDENNLIAPTVVLAGNVTLTKDYTASNAFNLDLHGCMLSGGTLKFQADATLCSSQSTGSVTTALTLDSDDAVLNVAENTTASSVTVTAYSAEKLYTLLTERIETVLGEGFKSGESLDVLPTLSFYVGNGATLALSGANCSLTDSTILSTSRSATDVASLTLTVGDSTKTFDFKLYGNDAESVLESIKTTELAHIEALSKSQDDVMCDIFLPCEIKRLGASVEWISGNSAVLSADGRIIDDSANRVAVPLYANVRINEKVYQLSYSVTVSGVSNETRFSNFIAQLSPLKLKEVWDGSGVGETGFVKSHQFLPIVNSSSTYDYRKKFSSPDGSVTTAVLDWAGYEDIGFKTLTYSQDATYNYISVYTNASGEQAVYLNTPVFSTFAQINLTGTFDGDDTVYSGTVNIIIEAGNYEELLDDVFGFVQDQLDATDIYKNIVKTRRADGMAKETGDFTINTKYVISSESDSNRYSIEVSTSNSNGVLSVDESKTESEDFIDVSDGVTQKKHVVKYHIAVDLTKATQVESRVPITVTVKYTYQPEVTSTRTLYVTVPAVILPNENGFSNYSVFSSVKYQMYACLPDDERTKPEEAFTVEGDSVINRTGAYILRNDVDRCNGNTGENWFDGEYAGEPLTIPYAEKLNELYFMVGTANSADTVEEKVYGLVQLIQYATGNEKGTKSVTVGGTTYSVTADGKDYLTPTEITNLQDYCQAVANLSDNEWSEIFESISNYPTANGTRSRVVSDPEALGDAIKDLTNDGETYFKYTELMRWALNEQNFPKSSFHGTDYPDGNPPNGGKLSYNNNYTTTNGNSYYIQQEGTNSVKSGYFNEDNTKYISEREEVVLQAFWNTYSKLSSFQTAFANYTVTPTYLEENAVSVLVSKFYEKLGTSDFAERLVTYTDKDGSVTVPAITTADGSLNGFIYFANLDTVAVCGNVTESGDTYTANLPAFLHTDSLATFYNRLTASDIGGNLVKLVLRNVAQDYVSFNLDGISAFKSLKYLDLGMNYGITALGSALDVNSKNLEYIDLSGANCEGSYSEYPLSVLNTGRSVYYTPDEGRNGKTATKVSFTGTTDGTLSYLRELETINSQYEQLQQKIYTSGSTASDIYWQVDSGNPIYPDPVDYAGTFTAGTYGTANNTSAMLGQLTNYYYCTADVTLSDGTALQAGYLYPIKHSDGSFAFDVDNKTQLSRVSSSSTPELSDDEKNALMSQTADTTTYDFEITGSTSSSSDSTTTLKTGSSNTSYYVAFGGNSASGLTDSSSTYRVIYYIATTTTTSYNFTYRGNIAAVKSVLAYLSTGNEVISYTYSYGKTGEITGTISVAYTTYKYYGNTSSTSTTNETNRVELDPGDSTYIYWRNSRRGSYNTSNRAPIQTDGYTSTSYRYTYNSSVQNKTGTVITGTDDTTLQTWLESNSDIQNHARTLANSQTNSSYTATTKTYTMSVPQIASADDAQSALSRLENISNGVQQFDSGYNVYYYSGSSGSATYTKDGSDKSYTFSNGSYYKLVWNATSGLTWQSVTVSNASSTSTTMESILALANADVGTVKRGNWLGLYVWYQGSSESSSPLTVNGRTYEKGYVYRIVWADDSHTVFTYERYRTCSAANATTFQSLPLNASTTGEIYYLTASTNYYASSKFYIMTFDSVGGFYYLNRFDNVSPMLRIDYDNFHESTSVVTYYPFPSATSHDFMRIRNEKIYVTSADDYSGTGGSAEVEISAVVKIDGVEYKRTFKVTVTE